MSTSPQDVSASFEGLAEDIQRIGRGEEDAWGSISRFIARERGLEVSIWGVGVRGLKDWEGLAWVGGQSSNCFQSSTLSLELMGPSLVAFPFF